MHGLVFRHADVKTDRGYQSARYLDIKSTDQSTITIVEATETYSNDAKCYEIVPAPIDLNATRRIIGGKVNGIKPYFYMASLITVAERLLALQAETIAL
jgi:hypothetical protein